MKNLNIFFDIDTFFDNINRFVMEAEKKPESKKSNRTLKQIGSNLKKTGNKILSKILKRTTTTETITTEDDIGIDINKNTDGGTDISANTLEVNSAPSDEDSLLNDTMLSFDNQNTDSNNKNAECSSVFADKALSEKKFSGGKDYQSAKSSDADTYHNRNDWRLFCSQCVAL